MTLWLEALDRPSSSFTLTPAVRFLGKEGNLLCKHQGLLEEYLVCVWSWLPQRTDSLILSCSSIGQKGHFLIGWFKTKNNNQGLQTHRKEGPGWTSFIFWSYLEIPEFQFGTPLRILANPPRLLKESVYKLCQYVPRRWLFHLQTSFSKIRPCFFSKSKQYFWHLSNL